MHTLHVYTITHIHTRMHTYTRAQTHTNTDTKYHPACKSANALATYRNKKAKDADLDEQSAKPTQQLSIKFDALGQVAVIKSRADSLCSEESLDDAGCADGTNEFLPHLLVCAL